MPEKKTVLRTRQETLEREAPTTQAGAFVQEDRES